MNALILAALPVVALAIVAVVGLVWLREPVSADKPATDAVGQEADEAAEVLARLQRDTEVLARAIRRDHRPARRAAPRAKAG